MHYARQSWCRAMENRVNTPNSVMWESEPCRQQRNRDGNRHLTPLRALILERDVFVSVFSFDREQPQIFGGKNTRRRLVPNRRRLVPNRRRLVPNRRRLVPNRRRLVPNRRPMEVGAQPVVSGQRMPLVVVGHQGQPWYCVASPQVAARLKALENLLMNVTRPPTLVTICRSVKDGYGTCLPLGIVCARARPCTHVLVHLQRGPAPSCSCVCVCIMSHGWCARPPPLSKQRLKEDDRDER